MKISSKTFWNQRQDISVKHNQRESTGSSAGEELSEERKAQTFFHELTHAVLDAIGEDELNENEQFIKQQIVNFYFKAR